MIRALDSEHSFGAEPLKFAVFEHAQDFYLGKRAHLRNFVEEQCAAVGQFEFSLDALLRAGEGPALMTEKLALQQCVAHGRGVKRNERLARARRRIVDGVSEQSFTCPVSPSRTTGTFDFAASAANCRQRAMASLLVVRSSTSESGGRFLHGKPRNYCLMFSRNCRIGSKAYSIRVAPPTMICASPFIPTRSGRALPAAGIAYRSSEPSATKCEPSVRVTAEGLIQSSFPLPRRNADKETLRRSNGRFCAMASFGRPDSFKVIRARGLASFGASWQSTCPCCTKLPTVRWSSE